MRRTVCQLAMLAAILVASPAFAQSTAHSHPQEKSAAATQSAQHMDDAMYVRMMRTHHEQGMKMAQLAVEKAQRPEVKQFAPKTVTDQKQDIQRLDKIEKSLGQTDTPTTGQGQSGTSGHMAQHEMQGGHMMGGMMDDKQMQMGQQMLDKLQGLSGAAFDREFIRSMINHHQMAIRMSQPSTKSTSSEVQAFAAETVKKQSAEVKELEAMQKKS